MKSPGRSIPWLAALALSLWLIDSSPASAQLHDLTVAHLNVLHGLGCTPANCRLPDRIDLLFDWIEAASCPDVVTLQEVNSIGTAPHARTLIESHLATACSGQYDGNVVYANVLGIDEEMVLSKDPIVLSVVREFHAAIAFTRHALLVRLDRDIGQIDVVTTHLASGADSATSPCDVDSNGDQVIDIPCPAECSLAGATTIRQCQVVQLVDFVNEKHTIDSPAVVTGDFNAAPGSFEIDWVVLNGWVDTYLEAGNAECDAFTGAGCTSGRDDSLAELEATAVTVDRRIDYAFLVPPPAGSSCFYHIDGPGDDDGDGSATRHFADAPNPFATCGASPDPVCWISDHNGNELDLNLQGCDTQPIPTLPPGALLLLAVLLCISGGFVVVGSSRAAKRA